MSRYPFKFLDAYNREDKNVFFGRDDEIQDLYEMIFQSPVVLVYGASGTGKTSLIQCGLAGRFETHDWQSILIRRNGDISRSLQKALEEAGGNAETTGESFDWLDEIMETTTVAATKEKHPLLRALKNLYKASFRPVYLVFDQLEELFILGSANEQQQLIASVQELLTSEQPVKLIFSIREEYLGHLNHFEKAVPQLFRKKLRVEPMNLAKVQQVLKGATTYHDSNISLKETEVVQAIFDKVRGDQKTFTIQLPYLQVYLDKLYLQITGDHTRIAPAVFGLEAVARTGSIGDILGSFLEEQATNVTRQLTGSYPSFTIAILWNILSPFATLEGTKEPMNKAALYERLPAMNTSMIDATLEALITSRILRYQEETDLYELAHDSLAKRVAEKRSDEEIALLEVKRLVKSHTALKAEAREMFSERQLAFIEPYLSKIKLTADESALIQQSHRAAEERKKSEAKEAEEERKRLLERQQLLEKNQQAQKRLITWISAALIIMIGLLVYAYNQQQKATANAATAKAALLNIQKQQALSKAMELKGFGDRYRDLGKIDYACDSYKNARDTIAAYTDDPLYQTLTKILNDTLKCR